MAEDTVLPRSWTSTERTWDGADISAEDQKPSHGRSPARPQYYDRQPSWRDRRRSSRRSSQRRSSVVRHPSTSGAKKWWKFTLREWDDDDDSDWWFASTAIPLLAATLGPLANVLSIAALVTYWRMCLVSGVDKDDAAQCIPNGSDLLMDLEGKTYRDPHWCFNLNVVSLVVGFVGNFFLLCNFTNRIRYIIALPVTIVMWYVATGILIALTVSMEVYVPPTRPQQIYTQGFWYAVIAACMYMVCSMLLMVNMLGYFLGHYPQHFTLTESQRTLILQTMMFFIWLAGGGGVFSRVESLYGNGEMDWGYVNALYFCDVTILTVGFGDLYPTSNVGRGLIFPYSVGGIIMLGLMVSSIQKFAAEIGSEKVIRRHIEHTRARTIGRTVTSSLELEHRKTLQDGERPVISAPMAPISQSRHTTINIADEKDNMKAHRRTGTGFSSLLPVRTRRPRLLLLREEKDRFDAMRQIEHDTAKFKRWSALAMSITAFGLLWCGGAVVFWRAERITQDMTYFQALYFCYVSLITIGYGDLSPKSNPGRPFFVFWSLLAVPTMTILVSDLGETVIDKFKNGTSSLADFTVLPKSGVLHEFVSAHPRLTNWLEQRKERKAAERRQAEGFQVGPETEQAMPPMTIDELAKDEPSRADLARRLPGAIRQTIDDMRTDPKKSYTYEEWVELTRLIRFSARKEEDLETDGEDEGLIEWDWIGEDSPMMSKGTEAEFVLARLCESMNRYVKQVTSPSYSMQDGVRREPPAQRRDDSEKGSLRRRRDETPSESDGEVGPRGEKSSEQDAMRSI